jgi:hypothetical protein
MYAGQSVRFGGVLVMVVGTGTIRGHHITTLRATEAPYS